MSMERIDENLPFTVNPGFNVPVRCTYALRSTAHKTIVTACTLHYGDKPTFRQARGPRFSPVSTSISTSFALSFSTTSSSAHLLCGDSIEMSWMARPESRKFPGWPRPCGTTPFRNLSTRPPFDGGRGGGGESVSRRCGCEVGCACTD